MTESAIRSKGRRMSHGQRARLTRWVPRLLVIYPFLVVIAALLLYPVFWMMYSSLKSNTAVLSDVFALPKKPTFGNFSEVFSTSGMDVWITNSTIIAVASTAAIVVLSALAAYGFAVFRFRGKELLFVVMLVGLMVPAQALMIAGYQWMTLLHLLDTYWALIFTYCAWSSFGILVLRNFFESVPREIRDAARIDGAGHWHMFTKIMLPLAKPSLATVAIFNFLWVWNEFIYPLVYVQSEELRTIPLGILDFQGRSGIQWGLLMAALTVATVVPLLVYIVFQRQFVRGLLEGAVKG
jgi:ABC-type glycerol-3-phosphate transport system permease component